MLLIQRGDAPVYISASSLANRQRPETLESQDVKLINTAAVVLLKDKAIEDRDKLTLGSISTKERRSIGVPDG
jgi:hypothetical protein